MAPKKRAPRDISKVLQADGEPAPLLPDNTETGRLQRYKSWTPIPREEEEFMTWARKHWGERYFELREARRREKDHLKDPLKYYDMLKEMGRIQRSKTREHEREKKAALGDNYIPDRFVPLDDTDSDNASPPPDDIDNNDNLKRGKTWQELIAWARMHYGEAWYAQRQVLEREEREDEERGKISSKAVKRLQIVREMELQRDEGMLAEGKTWHEIMAWPADPSNILPSVETGGDIVYSPSSSSEHSNVSGYSTYPPTPTNARRQAMDGPQGPETRSTWRWERLEWDAVRSRMSEAQYEEERVRIADGIKSRRKDEERKRRLDAELEAIRHLKSTLPKDPDGAWRQMGEYERLMRHYNLREQGWTQEQIDAADRADTAAWEWKQKNPPPKEPSLFGPPLTQEERDAYDAWLQKERAARVRIYGELPPSGSALGQHNPQEERDYQAWRRNIHARVSSQHEQEPAADATADASAPEKASPLRAPTPRAIKNTSRKTRGGRITKNTTQSQSVARGTQSQRTAPTLVQASIANRQSKRAKASDVVDKSNESAAQVSQKTRKTQPKVDKKRASDVVHDIDDQVLQSKLHNTRQRKVYKQERGSRRLAGHLPEYGMLPKRGEPAPPYEPPSNTRKPPHSRASSKKKSIAVKGAKPRGISKSGREGTNRPKRSKKRPED